MTALLERPGSEAQTASANGSGRRALLPAALWRNSRGAVAVEFALVALPLFILVLGVFEIGYDLFVQATMDRIVQETAQIVQVGAAAGNYSNDNSTDSVANFMTKYVQPLATGLLNPADITINVESLPTGKDYSNVALPARGSVSAVCTGIGGQAMLLTAWYTGPTFLGSLIPGFATSVSGALVHVTTASVGFVNEYFPTADNGSC